MSNNALPPGNFYSAPQPPQPPSAAQPTPAQRSSATDADTWFSLSPFAFLKMPLPDLTCSPQSQGYTGTFSKSSIVEKYAIKITMGNLFNVRADSGELLIDKVISFIQWAFPNNLWTIYMQRFGGYVLREQQVTWHMDKTIYTPSEILYNKVLGLGITQDKNRPVFTLKFLPTPPCILNDVQTKKTSYLEPDRVLVLCRDSYTKLDPKKKDYKRLPKEKLVGEYPNKDDVYVLAIVDSKLRNTLAPKTVDRDGNMSNEKQTVQMPHSDNFGETIQTDRFRGDQIQQCFNQLRTYCALFECEFGFATEMNWTMACHFGLRDKTDTNPLALPRAALVDTNIAGSGENRGAHVGRFPRRENVQSAFLMVVLRAVIRLNLANDMV